MLNNLNLTAIAELMTQSLRKYHTPDSIFEIRILNTKDGICSGLYQLTEEALKKFATDILPYINDYSIYFTLNPINSAKEQSISNRIVPRSRTTTKDAEIEKINYLHIDLDPVRTTNTASTDEESQKAIDKAIAIKNYLEVNFNMIKPIFAFSGNGYTLDYFLDGLPNTIENKSLLKNILLTLDMLFSDEYVKVDTCTFNPARIIKLCGSYSFKGDNSPERPFRQSYILESPNVKEKVLTASLNKLARISISSKEDAKKTAKWKNNYKDIDMETYLSKLGISIHAVKRIDNATIFTLNDCPWNKEHTNKSAFVIKFDDGGVHASCLHDSCRDKSFKDFKVAIGDTSDKSDSDTVDIKELESTIIKTVDEFFIDQSKKSYASVIFNETKKNYLIKSEDFEKYIIYLTRAEHDVLLPSTVKNLLLDSFNAKAAFSGNIHLLKRRMNQLGQEIYYDLCDKDCTVIKLSKDGIELINNAPILFHRTDNMLEQIKPNLQADIKSLLGILSKHFRISDKGELLLFAVFLVTCFVPNIAHVIAIIKGEKGAAKSTALKMSRKIVDPSVAPISAPPTKKDDMISTLTNNCLNCFDNVTSINQEMSDILCISSTGGHVSKRGLYSNNDEFNADVKSIVMLNGINVASSQSDFLDRAMIIELDRIPSEERRTEEDVWKDFDIDVADIFGICMQIVSIVLGKLEKYQFESLPRMADFYKWGYCIAEEIGSTGEDFATAYATNQNIVNTETINSNSFATTLAMFLDDKEEWRGTAAELLKELEKTAYNERIDINDIYFPKSASLLSRNLNLIKSNLADIGITYERGVGSRGTKTITFKNVSSMV